MIVNFPWLTITKEGNIMGTNVKVRKMCYMALATAIICVLGPLSVNILVSPVPISLAIFGIYIASYALGARRGSIACILYVLIGLIGVPVFAAYTGGPQKLFGPTGGYIIGYIAVAFFTGLFIEKFENRPYMHFAGMAAGLLICYAVGTAWLAFSASMTFTAALSAGVLPFIPLDIVKMAMGALVGIPLRKALKRADFEHIDGKLSE